MVTAQVLYEVPLLLEKAGVGDYIVERLGLKARATPDWAPWKQLVEEVRKPKPVVNIALVGKYVELKDAYMSVREAVKHAALSLGVEAEIQWVHSADLEKGKGWDEVKAADGIIVPGGFGSRGIEGKIQAAGYARENKVPYLGLCLGMQVMCVEFARNVLGHEDANSTEFDRSTKYPVIDLMLEQRAITDMGGTMRLGLYPVYAPARTPRLPKLTARNRWRNATAIAGNSTTTTGRNSKKPGWPSRASHRMGCWWRFPELKDHPYMVGSQFHPEFLSRPDAPAPIVCGVDQGSQGEKRKEMSTRIRVL